MRDAAKRAPAQAGASGAGAARANVNVNPVGDWTTQAADPTLLLLALGTENVKQRAISGDREAKWSLGCRFMSEAKRAAGTPLGASWRRSPKADVGSHFALHSIR